MERFIACPFQHFAVHGLRLQERRLFRVDAPDIGQLFHAALRQTTEKLFAEGPAGMDSLRWQMEAAAAVDKLLPAFSRKFYYPLIATKSWRAS